MGNHGSSSSDAQIRPPDTSAEGMLAEHAASALVRVFCWGRVGRWDLLMVVATMPAYTHLKVYRAMRLMVPSAHVPGPPTQRVGH